MQPRPASSAATIRPFRPDDAPAVVEVVRAAFLEHRFHWDLEGYCADLADPLAHYQAFWCAEHQGKVVGCVGLALHPLVPGDGATCRVVQGVPRVCATDCELVRLYLALEARGQGLGRRLAQTVRDEARALRRTALEVWSDKTLASAHRLYQRMGAKLAGERICPGDPDHSPEWGYWLPLA